MAIVILSFSFQIKDAASTGFILTTILGLLSGVFFPVDLIPFPMSDIVYVLPLTQSLTVIRELTLVPDITPNWPLIYILTAEALAFLTTGLILYKRNIRYMSLRY